MLVGKGFYQDIRFWNLHDINELCNRSLIVKVLFPFLFDYNKNSQRYLNNSTMVQIHPFHYVMSYLPKVSLVVVISHTEPLFISRLSLETRRNLRYSENNLLERKNLRIGCVKDKQPRGERERERRRELANKSGRLVHGVSTQIKKEKDIADEGEREKEREGWKIM